jgi:YVTN family beta-propeller protein
MEISVLGPLRVTVAGRAIRLPARQRVVLAILALQVGQAISMDRLVQALWGEEPPDGATKTLQTHVFQLRRSLAFDPEGETGPVIVTDGHGYRLDLDPSAIDAGRFRHLLDEGRKAAQVDRSRARELLAQALGLWRGPTLPDVGDDAVANTELHQLDELRVAAVGELVQVCLALGDDEGAVQALRRELGTSPYRERLWIDLMLVLDRAGRRAEALLVYREAEQALRRELDVEPSLELRGLAGRIREGGAPMSRWPDTAMTPGSALPAGAPSGPATVVSASGPSTTEAQRRPTTTGWMASARARALVLGLSIIVVVVGAAIGRAVVGGPRPTPTGSTMPISAATAAPTSVPIVADSVAWLAGDGHVAAASPVGALPDGIAVGAGSVWVANTTDGTVTRLTRTNAGATSQTIRVGIDPTAVTFAFNALWVTDSGEQTVSRIDPVTDQVVASIAVGVAPAGVTSDGHSVWVTDRLAGTVTRIDPQSDATATFPVGATPDGVASTPGALWVTDFDSGALLRLDPGNGAVVDRISVGNGPSAVATSNDSVWVENSRDGTVSRIDPATDSVQAVVSVGQDPGRIAFGQNALWVPVGAPAGLVRIDAQTNAVKHFPMSSSPASVAIDGTEPVFTVRAVSTADHRGGTLRVVSTADYFPDTPDPTFALYSAVSLTMLTNDGLLGYQRAAGPEGLVLVPDLAAAMPTSLDGGLTYRFQMRAGLEYSTGEPVRASDVLRSIERAVLVPNNTLSFDNLVGAVQCTGARSCDLSKAIVANDQTGTVTFHLSRPDPNFLWDLAWPSAAILPGDTPLAESSTPLPATGPYEFESFSQTNGIRLVRNPRFREWSSQAQPDGNPDAIEWQIVPDGQDPSLLVQSGAADWTADPLTAQRIAYLAVALPGQLHVAPLTQTFFEVMNTTIPPFDDPNVRQAVNLATDRNAAVDAYGGNLAARVTCQFVPPSFEGYVPYCPYTVDPGTGGTWIGPDLASARSLIAAAGVKGESVTVYGLDLPGHREVAAYFTGLLQQLGFKAQTRLMSLDGFWGTHGILTAPSKVQMAGFWFATESPTAEQMIVGDFTCPDYLGTAYFGYPSEFCDRSIDALVTQAIGLQEAGESAAADALWATIDQKLTDASPAIAAFNPTDVQFVSGRVGGFQDHAVLTALLDQLWVR